MASFLLVHGSWHGAWCWDRLIPLLHEHGHQARAIDLPAHGEDRAPFFTATLGSYARRVRSAAQQFANPPILVGHSMAGAVLTHAAAHNPHAFAALIYVCAFAPRPGQSIWRLAHSDTDSLLHGKTAWRPNGIGLLDPSSPELFYGQCDPADAAAAIARLRNDPAVPLIQTVRLPIPATMPCGYVECLRDRAVTIRLQRTMHSHLSNVVVRSIDTDHSPFLSKPQQLADYLHELSTIAR